MSKSEIFDYVIVGGGSAGCVLANRLSANPDISVCLIEAGKKQSSLMVRMPAGVGNLIGTGGAYNWGFWTKPQAHMEDRKLWWPRGRGVGGSSLINGMIYTRGHPSDYDVWRQSGLAGWGYSDILPYFRKSEGYQGECDQYHGADGPLKVTDSPLQAEPYKRFIDASVQAGFPKTDDFNGADQNGVGPYQRTIFNGARASVAAGYLTPDVEKRPNLTIKSEAIVSRIIFRGGEAYGVETLSKRGAQAERIHAAHEVVLCAGAVQSPQILMLSGIGPADHLAAHGITCVANSPQIGQNLQDHLDISVIHHMTKKQSAHSQRAGIKTLFVGMEYLMKKSGPGADNFLQAGAFLKSEPSLDVPDVQLHFVNAIMIEHGKKQVPKDGFTVHGCQLRPNSRGSIMLGSADPFDHPVIDPNYLQDETDRRIMRNSVKLMREICAQEALTPLRGTELMPGESIQTDAEIDTFVRRHAETIYHPIGTVHMGIRETAPVDPELKVRGVEKLRVVDASVMPTLIGGNTNAPTVMIAEKAADMMLGVAPLPAQLV